VRATRESEHELLVAGARELGIDLDPAGAEALLRLVDELELGNAQFNLTAIRDRPGMLRKHVLDSLSVQPYLRGLRIADIGTGAGFPGLPLAIVNPQRRFTLVEATGKKARFADQTARRLGCENVRIEQTRAENYRPFELFDTVVARALSSLADFAAYAGHLCAPGGRLLAMKGKRPDEEISALPKSFRVLAVHRLKVPGLDDERHLVELSPARAVAAAAGAVRRVAAAPKSSNT
jgi:16S rRNA (guanine527-N7)-methyltransferase